MLKIRANFLSFQPLNEPNKALTLNNFNQNHAALKKRKWKGKKKMVSGITFLGAQWRVLFLGHIAEINISQYHLCQRRWNEWVFINMKKLILIKKI